MQLVTLAEQAAAASESLVAFAEAFIDFAADPDAEPETIKVLEEYHGVSY